MTMVYEERVMEKSRQRQKSIFFSLRGSSND